MYNLNSNILKLKNYNFSHINFDRFDITKQSNKSNNQKASLITQQEMFESNNLGTNNILPNKQFTTTVRKNKLL
jgi:hypothetical protein